MGIVMERGEGGKGDDDGSGGREEAQFDKKEVDEEEKD